MRRFFLPIAVLSLFFVLSALSGPVLAAGTSLEFLPEFENDEFSLADNRIILNLKIKNTGNMPVWVNKRFFINKQDSPPDQREVYLVVTSPSGEVLPSKVDLKTGLPRTDYFVLLGPGEEATVERPKNIKYYYDFSVPGEYTVKAVYQNVYGDEIGIDAFKERIESVPVRITLTGKE